MVNDERFIERAEIMRDKGTNRSSFFRGEVDKYTWTDLGSSYALSDLAAAFLYPSCRTASDHAPAARLWDLYHEAFAERRGGGLVRRPIVPRGASHNAHMYYLLLPGRARGTT